MAKGTPAFWRIAAVAWAIFFALSSNEDAQPTQ
jgi:hypothetical protein